MPPHLNNYLDAQGSVRVYPSKLKNKLLVLRYLALKFEAGRQYTEREVNEVLRENHTFGDWALLRRDMFEVGLLHRNRDGSSYWKAQPETE
jgi:hypothetical protein